ncbi:MAG: hypothetical protein JXA23_07050 [Bacteroidales bacterium]|nr:hypothetical protein [Bacteroidales bacterium]
MNFGFGDFKRSEACRLFAALDVAFEAEAQDHHPVGVATLPAGHDGFVHRLLAHRAEPRTDVKIGFVLAFGCVVKSFGMKPGISQQLHAGKIDPFILTAVLDPGRKQVLFDLLLPFAHLFGDQRFFFQFRRTHWFEILKGFHGKRTAYPQHTFVGEWLVVEGLGFGGLIVG